MMIPIRIDAEFDDFEVRYAIYKFLVLSHMFFFFVKYYLKSLQINILLLLLLLLLLPLPLLLFFNTQEEKKITYFFLP
jgi:hypothetical protein